MSVHEDIASALELQAVQEEQQQRYENAQLMYAAATSIRRLRNFIQMLEQYIEGGIKFNPDGI